MLFEFEKLLKDNNISETDPTLPKTLVRKFEKFRSTQKKLELAENDQQRDEINKQLDDLDTEIMKTLPDFFDIEDEEEIRKQAQKDAEQKRI